MLLKVDNIFVVCWFWLFQGNSKIALYSASTPIKIISILIIITIIITNNNNNNITIFIQISLFSKVDLLLSIKDLFTEKN